MSLLPGGRAGWAALGVVVGVLAAAGLAYAAIPDQGGVFHACYKTVGGQLRLVQSASDCNPSETATKWSQTGTAGPPGPTGPTGTAGPTGPNGPSLLAGGSGGETLADIQCYVGVGAMDCSGPAAVSQVVATSGTVKSLFVHISVGPGTGSIMSYTLKNETTATPLAECAISNTAQSCSDTVGGGTISAGDTVSLFVTAIQLSASFTTSAVTWSAQIN